MGWVIKLRRIRVCSRPASFCSEDHRLTKSRVVIKKWR